MNKLLLLCLLSFNAFAGSSNLDEESVSSGIVTPNIAIGVYRIFAHYTTISQDGQILVCRNGTNLYNDVCKNSDGKNGWQYIQNSVPKGRTYIGFKSITAGSNQYLEVYWR